MQSCDFLRLQIPIDAALIEADCRTWFSMLMDEVIIIDDKSGDRER